MSTPHHFTGDECLDAETIAAWVDGGLSGDSRALADAHLSNCARCRAIVATMARVEPAMAAAPAAATGRRWLGWLVPAAAAAVVVGIVLLTPGTPGTPGTPDTPAATGAPAATARTDAAPKPGAPGAFGATGKAATGTVTPSPEGMAKAEPPAAPPRAQAAAPAAPRVTQSEPLWRAEAGLRAAADAMVPLIVHSPDPLVRWRVDAGRVSRSTDGGTTWVDAPTVVAADVTAGASPAPSVLWLAGRGGTVLLTTDGRDWRRLPFPEATDLSAIRATDARTATVTTADGREFATTDAGATWIRR